MTWSVQSYEKIVVRRKTNNAYFWPNIMEGITDFGSGCAKYPSITGSRGGDDHFGQFDRLGTNQEEPLVPKKKKFKSHVHSRLQDHFR